MHWAAFFTSIGSIATAMALFVGFTQLRQQRQHFALQRSAEARLNLLQTAYRVRHYVTALNLSIRPASGSIPAAPTTEEWVLVRAQLQAGGATDLLGITSSLEQHLMAFDQALLSLEDTKPRPGEEPYDWHAPRPPEEVQRKREAIAARERTADAALGVVNLVEREVSIHTQLTTETWTAAFQRHASDLWERATDWYAEHGWRLSRVPGSAPTPGGGPPPAASPPPRPASPHGTPRPPAAPPAPPATDADSQPPPEPQTSPPRSPHPGPTPIQDQPPADPPTDQPGTPSQQPSPETGP